MGASASGLLIVVPARGGSKGLPGKNIRTLGGLPLLAWTARAISAAALPARAVLSTDDKEIAAVGRAHGLETPFLRPPALATDTAGMVAVVDHAVEWMERQAGYTVSAVMVLQPTSPFRRPSRLREALELLARPGTDGVIGTARIDRSASTLFREGPEGILEALAPWDDQTRRQDVRPFLTSNGTMYLSTRESLDRHRRLFPPRLRALPTNALEGLDIDTPEDWALAEAVVAAGLARP